jgi:fumarate reductase subunit D
VGLVLGTLLPLGLLYFGSQKLGISLVIPFSILGDYILLITAVYILVLFLGLRRLLKNSAA